METVLTILGLVYAGLIASRALVMFIVKLTKTEKDNKIANKIYAILDTYGVDFEKVLGKFKK